MVVTFLLCVYAMAGVRFSGSFPWDDLTDGMCVCVCAWVWVFTSDLRGLVHFSAAILSSFIFTPTGFSQGHFDKNVWLGISFLVSVCSSNPKLPL